MLLREDAPLGVVTAIVGYVRGRRSFTGNAGHAGTTPMEGREDALVAAAEFVLRARDVASAIDGAVATVGRALGRAGRHERRPRLRRPDGGCPRSRQRAARPPRRSARHRGADSHGAGADVGGDPRRAPRGARSASACRSLELPSGAGHDAGILASAGVPCGMLFVRSLNGGISHNPAELSSAEDIALAVDALTGALGSLAQT